MKQAFTKILGQVTEKLELDIEDKWIYVYYTRGNIEKTAYIIKNSGLSNEGYINSFLEDNHVSEDLKLDIKRFVSDEKNKKETDWHKFTIFLIKTLSFNIVICIMLGIAIFGGYKLGSLADERINLSPLFTIIGVLLGLIIGGFICYVMMMNYMKQSEEIEQKTPPLLGERKQKKYL
jgi:F0F1-type ATP synthase assembly protein I